MLVSVTGNPYQVARILLSSRVPKQDTIIIIIIIIKSIRTENID